LSRDDLKQIPTLEVFQSTPDILGILTGFVIAGSVHAYGRSESKRVSLTAKAPSSFLPPVRFPTPAMKLIVVTHGLLGTMIGHGNLVREIQDQITLALIPSLETFDILELKSEVITKGSIEAEVTVLVTPEAVDDFTQHREHTGSPTAVFFIAGKIFPPDIDLKLSLTYYYPGNRGTALECEIQLGKEHFTPLVQGGDFHGFASGNNFHRWIDEPDIQSGVATRIFEAGSQ
jgi:cyclophilin family peptidyl-prolyl cis-trans isomerase